jgi:hypothetical protein
VQAVQQEDRQYSGQCVGGFQQHCTSSEEGTAVAYSHFSWLAWQYRQYRKYKQYSKQKCSTMCVSSWLQHCTSSESRGCSSAFQLQLACLAVQARSTSSTASGVLLLWITHTKLGRAVSLSSTGSRSTKCNTHSSTQQQAAYTGSNRKLQGWQQADKTKAHRTYLTRAWLEEVLRMIPALCQLKRRKPSK